MPPYDLIDPNANLNLSINPQTDKFIIKGAAGVIVAHVQKPNGQIHSARVQANGALEQFTRFDPNSLSIEERRKLEDELYTKQMLTQSEISDLLGVSQATVSNDLRLLNRKK